MLRHREGERRRVDPRDEERVQGMMEGAQGGDEFRRPKRLGGREVKLNGIVADRPPEPRCEHAQEERDENQ